VRFVAYVRVSTTAGRDPATETSAPDQRRAIEQHAAARGLEVAEWVEDFDESGGRWERPGFQRALAMVSAGEADGLIVAKLDRFSRSLLDALNGIKMIDEAGGQFVSVADDFDTTAPMGRAMMQVSGVFAELERERIRENWQMQRADAVARGVQLGRAPAGYRRTADGTLELDSEAAPAIREVFLRRAAGASWEDLATFLDERLPRPNGGAWNRRTIAALVKRRTYLGEIRHGTVKTNAHEPLVTRAEWEAAQGDPHGPQRRSGSLLAGLVRCAGCSYTMTRTIGGGHAVYRCRRRHAGGHCPEPVAVSLDRLDAHVEGIFLAWAREQGLTLESTARTARAERALAELEDAEAELAAYRDETLVAIIGREAFAAGLVQRQKTVDGARRALADAQATTELPLGLTVDDLWEAGGTSDQAALLAGAVDAVFVRRARSRGQGTPIGDRARVLWRGEAPGDLPGRRGGVMRRFVDFDDAPGAAGMPRAGDGEHRVA
jgi:DNA invertase Pin-like site-specific DNA recombinase